MSKLLSPHRRRHNRTQPCWQNCDSSGKRKTHISSGNIMLGVFLMCLVGGSICVHTYTHVYGYICGSLRLVIGNLSIMPCLTYGRSVHHLTKAHRWGCCAQPACSQDALALPEECWDYQWGTMPTRLLCKSWDYDIWLSRACVTRALHAEPWPSPRGWALYTALSQHSCNLFFFYKSHLITEIWTILRDHTFFRHIEIDNVFLRSKAKYLHRKKKNVPLGCF